MDQRLKGSVDAAVGGVIVIAEESREEDDR